MRRSVRSFAAVLGLIALGAGHHSAASSGSLNRDTVAVYKYENRGGGGRNRKEKACNIAQPV